MEVDKVQYRKKKTTITNKNNMDILYLSLSPQH